MTTAREYVIAEQILGADSWALPPKKPSWTAGSEARVQHVAISEGEHAYITSNILGDLVSNILGDLKGRALGALPHMLPPDLVTAMISERDQALVREAASRAEVRQLQKKVERMEVVLEGLAAQLAAASAATAEEPGEVLATIVSGRSLVRSAEHGALARRVATTHRAPEDFEKWARDLAETVGDLTD